MKKWGRRYKQGLDGRITKVHEETFETDEYIHYLDYSDSFPGVYIFQNLDCILQI